MHFKKEYFLIVFLFAILLTGCKKWDDSIEINNPGLNQNLFQAISSDANLSTFSGYITKTGVDTILQSSKTFTVWAPTNAALQSLDPAIINDVTKLRAFVLNHISNQSYYSGNVQNYTRIAMLNGKYNNFFGNKFEDATVTTADKYAGNGVLHVIDKSILVLQNAWEFINATTSQYLQNSFIASLNFQSFDPNTATIDSISKLTGLPVYRPGTGIVLRNTFNERVYDLRREEKQYTYFVYADARFIAKTDSLKPYYKATSTSVTDSLSKWNVVKDLVVDTLYATAASLPSVLVSKFGIPIPIDKSAIIDTKKVSNGVVYVISASGPITVSKFPQRIIQGENPSGFFSDKTSSTAFQHIRFNPVTGQNYTELFIQGGNTTVAGLAGHNQTGYYAFYRLNEMPSMKYNVFALAVNEYPTPAIFQSIVPVYFTPPSTFTPLPVVSAILPANTTQLSYAVPLITATGAYNEVFLGSFTSNLYGTIDLRLTSGGSTLGSSGTGSITLDYLRIVPVP